jgi:hypothetical protein
MSNEELFYLLQKFYPGTLNGTHYLTGHQLDTGGNQVGEAFISNWKLPQPEPSPEQLLSWWYEHMVEVRQSVKAFHARDKRDGLLLDADAAVYKAEDAGDAA